MFSIFKDIRNSLSKIENYIEKDKIKNELSQEKLLKKIENYIDEDKTKNELSQKELLEKELFNAKHAETHSGFVNGWVNTKLERDKSILTLSSAGIGVLVTFFNFIKPDNLTIYYIYIGALAFFTISLITSIYIFKANADYLAKVINGKKAKSIAWLDYILSWSFIFGLLLTIFLSFSLINNNQKISNSKNLENKYIQLLESKIKNLERSSPMEENHNVNTSPSMEMKKKSFDEAENLYPSDNDKEEVKDTEKEKKDKDK